MVSNAWTFGEWFVYGGSFVIAVTYLGVCLLAKMNEVI